MQPTGSKEVLCGGCGMPLRLPANWSGPVQCLQCGQITSTDSRQGAAVGPGNRRSEQVTWWPFVAVGIVALLTVEGLRLLPERRGPAKEQDGASNDPSADPRPSTTTASENVPSPPLEKMVLRQADDSPSTLRAPSASPAPPQLSGSKNEPKGSPRQPIPRDVGQSRPDVPPKQDTPVQVAGARSPTAVRPVPPTASQPAPNWQISLNDLATKYGLEIIWEERPGERSGATLAGRAGRYPTEAELSRYVPTFVARFGAYPPDLVTKARLQRIVLCSYLSVDLHPWDGLAVPEQHLLFLDVARSASDERRLTHTLHHELFHLIDHEDDGTLEDEVWAKLNAPAFRYRRGTAGVPDDPTVLFSKSAPAGFVSKYSTVAVHEDKAEVFASMMAEPNAVWERAKDDVVLRAKVECMKTLLTRFSASIDDSFWKSPAPGQRETSIETPERAGREKPPDAWPIFTSTLPSGRYTVRVRNPNKHAVKIGLRSGEAGLDFSVPAEKSESVDVPSGNYEMYLRYDNTPDEVYQGDNIRLGPPNRGVEIQLVPAVGGNYKLRRVVPEVKR